MPAATQTTTTTTTTTQNNCITSSNSLSTINPAKSKLFKPLKVGNIQLNHRVVFPPLTRNRNDNDNTPLPFMAKYYADRGSTPGTLVISEATAISHFESSQRNTPGIHSDAQVEAWSKIIDAVHANGSYYFQQIWGIGRAAEPDLQAERGLAYRSSSAVPIKEDAPVPEAMTEEQIQETIRDFVDAAKKAIGAGADGVEIHSAHGYLLDQFLSDHVNRRTDKWGGSIENRARLFLEVIRAVVDAVGAERVSMRFSPYAAFQNAEKTDVVELYTHIITELKKMDAPFAYMSLVEATGDPGVIAFGANAKNEQKTLDFILEAWDNTSPVLVAGGYTAESAAAMLEGRYAKWDVMVAFGRLFLANPDLVFRFRHGLPLNKYNRPTFYKAMSEEGYIDYPFSKEFLEQRK